MSKNNKTITLSFDLQQKLEVFGEDTETIHIRVSSENKIESSIYLTQKEASELIIAIEDIKNFLKRDLKLDDDERKVD